MITIPWRKFSPFIFYALVATCLGIAAVISEERSFAIALSLFVLGLLSWSLGEYLIHRFAFHVEPHLKGLRSLNAMHLGHHDDPQGVDHLFISLWMSIPAALGYCLTAWVIVRDWRSMTYLFIGAIIGYIAYEWLHYRAHHSHSRLRLLKYLKKYHLLHHGETPKLRFGVTSPLFDYLFGTFQSVRDHH